jgi:serine protease Do
MSNVVVESVEPNSPAERAGLEIGDIVREINGNVIQSADQVYKFLEKYRPGDTVSFKIYRSFSGEGEVFEMNIILGQRP